MKEADGLREEVEKLKAKVGELETQVADGEALTKKAEAAAEAAKAKAEAIAKTAGEWRVTPISAAFRLSLAVAAALGCSSLRGARVVFS